MAGHNWRLATGGLTSDLLDMTSILIVTALLVVPGLGAALAFAPPGEASIETRVGLIVGLGYALVAGVAITLTLAHLLSRPSFIAGVVVATVAVWALAVRQASPRAHAAALARQARGSPYALASGLAVVAVVALTRPFYPTSMYLSHWAPWRYWADGLEIAAAGKVPATTEQWGSIVPTTVSKVVFNAFEAGNSFLLGPNPFVGMRAILVVTTAGLAAVLLALGRELGLRAFACLVPAFFLLFPGRLPVSGEFAGDFGAFRAENVGRLVAFTALVVGMYALRRGRRALVLVAAGVFALSGLTHGVATVVAMAAFALYALARLIIERSAWRRTVAATLSVFALAGAGYVAMLQLSGGDLGFQRVTSGTTVQGYPANIDPTRSFDKIKVVRRQKHDSRFFVPPSRIVRRYADTTVSSGGRTRVGALTLALLAIATVLIVVVARRFIPLAVVAWGLAAAFVGGALVFSFRYDTQIPGDFGLRRLYDYTPFLPALIVPAAVEVLAFRLLGRRRAALRGLVALAAVLAVVAGIDRVPDSSARAGNAIAASHEVARVVPCDARMLTNVRSAGSWEALTGRRSLTEGLAPYLRPEITGQVLSTLIGAKTFFGEPTANQAYLESHDVDYIVVLRPDLRVGSWRPFETDAPAIADLPGVEEVSSSPTVTIYSVGEPQADAGTSQPSRCPV